MSCDENLLTSMQSIKLNKGPPSRLSALSNSKGMNTQELDFYLNESNLRFKWGIICPDDCFCKNPETRKLILEAKELYDQMRESSTVSARVEAGVKMLNIYEELDISLVQKADLLYKLCQMVKSKATTSRKKRSRSQQHFIDYLKIRRTISSFELDPEMHEFFNRINTDE